MPLPASLAPVFLALGFVTAPAAWADATTSPLFCNPLCPVDTADPCILRVGETLYSYSTSGCHSFGAHPIRAARDDDRTSWTRVAAVFPAGGYPTWATKCDYWAPEVHVVGDRYICYYCVSDNTGRHAIGAATSSGPTGPFADLGHPLVSSPDYGVIDPHYFRDPRTGRHFLLWTDERQPKPIVMQELAPDGLALTGEPRNVLWQDREWEADVVEAPSVVFREGTYYLFYSGNSTHTENSYAVGVARADNVFGPYTKFPQPILKGNSRWKSPGHQFLFEESPGRWTMFYHAYDGENPKSRARILLAEPVRWNTNGWPEVSDGTPGVSQPPLPAAK